jgi:hypothetical protein
MSVATRVVVGLVTLWIIFYLAVYWLLLSPSSEDVEQQDDPTISVGDPVGIPRAGNNAADLIANSHDSGSGNSGSGGGSISGISSPFQYDSFVSATCQTRGFNSAAKGMAVTVVIVARNENKDYLLTTVSEVVAAV